MKEKIKDILLIVLYIVGMLIVFSFFESDAFQKSSIGNIIMTIGAIAGLVILGFIAYAFIVVIYVSIKDCFRRKIREEARRVVAEEKYLEKLRNKEKENEKK